MISAPLTQTFVFSLPPGSSDIAVVNAVRSSILAAATESLRRDAGGVAPTNITIVSAVRVAPDGSVTLTVRVLSEFSMQINTTATVSPGAYAADPSGATAAVIAAAASGRNVTAASAAISAAVRSAAAGTARVVNGSSLTGSPPLSLSARVALAASLALAAQGKPGVNASSLQLAGTAIVGETVVAIPSNLVVTRPGSSALFAGIAASGSASMSDEMQYSGGSSLVASFLAALAVAVFWWRRQRAAQAAQAKLTKISVPALQLQQSPRRKPNNVTTTMAFRNPILVAKHLNDSTISPRASSVPKGPRAR
jgi:hypothetical protein